MKKRGILILFLVSLLVFISCNLDSGQGVYQKVFNDTPKNFAKIITVLGVSDDSKLILFANNDIYSFDGNEMKKECEITSYSMDGGYVPFMAAGNHIFFSYKNENGLYKFFSATIDEINSTEGLSEDFVNNNQVTVNLPTSGDIVQFNGLYNFNLDDDETQVTYTLSSDNQNLTDPDKKITHYGYITKSNVSESSFTINGGAEVHSSATIIGHRALRVYVEDSDIEIGNNQLSDTNNLLILNESGSIVTNNISIRTNNNVDYDDLVMGTDGEFFITLEGNLYRINGDSYTSVQSDFASDLIYRANTLMPVFTADNGDTIGYLYEEGIYIKPANADEPVKSRISDDNDLVTSAWIGQSGNKILMATQENGFWIVELDSTNYQNSTTHQYDPEIDGDLSSYL